MTEGISHELKHHAPYTFLGALTGIVILACFALANVPHGVSHILFSVFHPLHILFSAMATAAMFRLHSRGGLLATAAVGYVGAIVIGTLSDCVVPYLGELLLGLRDEHIHAGLHLGFIEEWYLVNPLALAGVAIAYWRPHTKTPHAAHVLLSTWASLFHMLMAMQGGYSLVATTVVLIPIFLFLAVWVPCCTSDIVFPLLLARKRD